MMRDNLSGLNNDTKDLANKVKFNNISRNTSNSTISNNSASNNNNNLTIEFNQNFKRYLENKLLLSMIRKLTDDKTSVNETIQESFLKSFVDPNTDNNCQLISEPLSTENKKLLAEKIESELDTRLKDIAQHLNPIGDENETSDDEQLNRLRNLIESINDNLTKCASARQDMENLVQHSFNHSVEIILLLRKLLNDFKLDFYAKENEMRVSNEVLECDLLFKKIEKVEGEMMRDLYEQERAKSLSIVQNQIAFDTKTRCGELDAVNSRLHLFESMGLEFEQILERYNDLKQKLERKKFYIEKLKEDEIIF